MVQNFIQKLTPGSHEESGKFQKSSGKSKKLNFASLLLSKK